MGFSLGHTRQSPLNKRNYRHIALIVMVSAMFNALLVNLVLAEFDVNYFGKTADVIQVARFFVGDILGAATVIVVLAVTFRPLILRPKGNSD
jgi:hypothetical protein